jgi:hypothetical protein
MAAGQPRLFVTLPYHRWFIDQFQPNDWQIPHHHTLREGHKGRTQRTYASLCGCEGCVNLWSPSLIFVMQFCKLNSLLRTNQSISCFHEEFECVNLYDLLPSLSPPFITVGLRVECWAGQTFIPSQSLTIVTAGFCCALHCHYICSKFDYLISNCIGVG